MKIVIAPNTFKNALPANAVAQALKKGMLQAGFKGTIDICPVGDGGDGTGALLKNRLHAQTIMYPVADPLQRLINAPIGWLPQQKTAIIEMADASGLRLLKPEERNPLIANTRGTGQLLKAAIQKGAEKIIVCIGGSATVDGGTGILQALGVRFLNADNNEIHDLPLNLLQLYAIDTTQVNERFFKTAITVLCDVKNKLLGSNGAAAIFGSQKGATLQQVQLLEQYLTQLNDVVYKHTGITMSHLPHSGAAGGVAAALQVFFNAKPVDGISYFLNYIDFNAIIKNADVVITGEGSIDDQTAEGKAPFGVAMAAKKQGIQVIGVAGNIDVSANSMLHNYFDALININPAEMPAAVAIPQTAARLENTGKEIAKLLESV